MRIILTLGLRPGNKIMQGYAPANHYLKLAVLLYTSESISPCGDDGAKKTYLDGRGRGLSNRGTPPPSPGDAAFKFTSSPK